MVPGTLPSLLKGVNLPRLLLPRSTHHCLPSLVLLMHSLKMMLRLANHLLDISSYCMVCPLTGKPLYSAHLPAQLLKQSSMLSLLLVLNHNTATDSATILASHSITSRLFSVSYSTRFESCRLDAHANQCSASCNTIC
jgi:hypothetical protein